MKRILSIALSLALIASVFSCVPALAIEAEDVTLADSTSKLASISSDAYLLTDTASLSVTKTVSGSAPPERNAFKCL